MQNNSPAYYAFACPFSYGNARAESFYLENDEARHEDFQQLVCGRVSDLRLAALLVIIVLIRLRR